MSILKPSSSSSAAASSSSSASAAAAAAAAAQSSSAPSSPASGSSIASGATMTSALAAATANAAGAGAGAALDWKFQQVFGDSTKSEETPEPADIISAVEFDPTGNFLAIGDRGGRVVILERTINKAKVEYKVMTEFQSHEQEFDYLKSLEIEEKINQIKWCPSNSTNSHLLLTTNDKTIKLWKVHERQSQKVLSSNLNGTLVSSGAAAGGSGSTAQAAATGVGPRAPQLKQLKIPKMHKGDSSIVHTPKKVFANAHAYHINSISLNSDGETFISADDLRVNLWSLHHPKEAFTIVDIKPPNMEDLTEVITSASFHPTSCSTFLYSSSKGTLKLGDLRQSATCNQFTRVFEVQEDPNNRTFFSEIIASVSDAKFSPDGKFIVARDYMTMKVWDVRMESRPLKVLNIHEGLRSKLCDLYENDCIFDKFECCFSGDGNYVATGSYKNYFHVFDRQGRSHTPIEASRQSTSKAGVGGSVTGGVGGSSAAAAAKKERKSSLLGRTKKKKNESESFETSDFQKKCLHMCWHPYENTLAVAAVNSLYIFNS